MPKETEGTPQLPENSPDGQAEVPEQSQEQTQPEHPAAPGVDDAESQAIGQAEEPEPSDSKGSPNGDESAPQYTDDPDTSREEDWHHDDPYNHDYEHEDHHTQDHYHDEHHDYGHGEYQEDEHHVAHSVNASVSVPRSSDHGGGGDDGGWETDIDDDGSEYGGPVKSFLEHMEDLRWVLIRCVAALGVAMVACLAAAPIMVDFLSRPLGEAKQFLTENRKEALLEESKSEIFIRMTEDEVFRIPVETNLLEEAYRMLNLTNVTEPQSFNLRPAVEEGKLQLLLQPETNAVSSAAESSKAGPELKSMSPLSGFLVALQMAFYGGIMVALPFILYFLGQFIFPALRKKEKKYLTISVIIGGGLFFCGAAFCYFLLMKIALSTAALFANWLQFGADIWRAEDYIKFVCKFMIGMGLAFELPVVILLLVKIGVLDYKKLAKFRMYWVVINLVLASVLTPPDIITQVLMALPMQLFYELSVFIAWIWYRRDKKREEQRLKDEAEAAEKPPDEPEK
ncbi:MAG: twin-arginine translocase subunit TatC [Verrucomicrobiota bacterium]|nr:twin-arginine translocase subunit TatC [Verrucomicrobiota bacterium]